MDTQEYYRAIIGINTANLAANLQNVEINENILTRQKIHEYDNDKIIALLAEILEVLSK
jgi:hypothetical protein